MMQEEGLSDTIHSKDGEKKTILPLSFVNPVCEVSEERHKLMISLQIYFVC
jgi:hypothetical protein